MIDDLGYLPPPEIYPLRAQDSVPFLTPEIAAGPTVYRDVDVDGGANRGFSYCFARLGWAGNPIDKLHMPNFDFQTFATRVDGIEVRTADRFGSGHTYPPPPRFFERDEYLLSPESLDVY